MCGLVAVIAKGKFGLFPGDIDIFSELLFVDQLRGSHGTGIFYNKKNHVKISKAPVPSSVFLSYKEVENTLNYVSKNSNFIVGHNRSATKGKINAECTHPFKEGNIVLVHNGTLNNHKHLNSDVEVDSHAICHSINDIGWEKTVDKLDGAYALIWADVEEGTLNILRNFQRPLYMLETGSLYILCSEEDMGKWIVGRNNEKIIQSFSIVPNKLYKFDISDMSMFTTIDVPQKQYTKPVVVPTVHTPNKEQRHQKAGAYIVGQTIRFKAKAIVCHLSQYLNCDIYDNNVLIDKRDRVDIDYEGQNRVNVYGDYTELKRLYNIEHLEGTIESCHWRSGKACYVVTDVKAEETEKKPEDVKNLGCCEFCTADFLPLDTIHIWQGWSLCKECYDQMSEELCGVC